MSMSGNFNESSLAAANWWADHVFGGTVTSSGGGPDAGFTMALSILAGVQGTPQPDNKREAFVNALALRIAASMDRLAGWNVNPMVSIGVDYGPDPMLADAAEDAGLQRANFPWKTNMWVYPTHVTASLGYGAHARLIWQDPEWERPQCLQGQYDEGPGYERLPFKCSGLIHHQEEHTFDIPDPLCVAQVKDYDGVSMKKCNHPEGDDWHHIHKDGYRSSMYHEFTTN